MFSPGFNCYQSRYSVAPQYFPRGGDSNVIVGEAEKAMENSVDHPPTNKPFTQTQGDVKDSSYVIRVEEEQVDDDVVVGEDDGDTSKISQKDTNSYAAKKTVAQGMMDIALITANANQLRYMVEFNKNSTTYYLNLFLISVSLILQVGVGVSLIFKGRMDLKGQSKSKNAKRINKYVVAAVFLVTIINVFIASFTIVKTGNSK